jgi:hypothetical protein
MLLAAVIWVLVYIGMRYLGMVFPGLELHIPLAVMTGIVLGSYGWLGRRLWKTKLVNPRPCDPCNHDMDWGRHDLGRNRHNFFVDSPGWRVEA